MPRAKRSRSKRSKQSSRRRNRNRVIVPSSGSEPNLFPCRRCDKVYDKQTNLNRHISDRHIGTRCYWPGCGRTTETELELIQHLKEHQLNAIEQGIEETVCPWPNCGKSFGRSDTVQRCLKHHINYAPRGI